ncbi:MAG: hypothetical protein GY696_10455 [Gammaproteobacteria bacterium]|nr:hypothetical protein [Gammaproteobacteria bacterium]
MHTFISQCHSQGGGGPAAVGAPPQTLGRLRRKNVARGSAPRPPLGLRPRPRWGLPPPRPPLLGGGLRSRPQTPRLLRVA